MNIITADAKQGLAAAIQQQIIAALEEDAFDAICVMLDDALSKNTQDEQQVTKTQLTFSPKIRIDYDRTNQAHIKCTIPVKTVTTVTGESEGDYCFNGEQELPLDGGNAE